MSITVDPGADGSANNNFERAASRLALMPVFTDEVLQSGSRREWLKFFLTRAVLINLEEGSSFEHLAVQCGKKFKLKHCVTRKEIPYNYQIKYYTKGPKDEPNTFLINTVRSYLIVTTRSFGISYSQKVSRREAETRWALQIQDGMDESYAIKTAGLI